MVSLRWIRIVLRLFESLFFSLSDSLFLSLSIEADYEQPAGRPAGFVNARVVLTQPRTHVAAPVKVRREVLNIRGRGEDRS